MSKKPISRAGFDTLASELKNLKEVERPEILIAIQEARALGDLSENAEYSSAREKQRHIDKRIRYLEETIANAQVIDISGLSGDRVMFGAHVVIVDQDGREMRCQVLSDIESDGKSVIACTSPVGRGLMGKCVGDFCTVKAPSGDREYEILEVDYK